MKNIYPAGAALAAILMLSPSAPAAESKGKPRGSADQPVARSVKSKSVRKAAAAANVIREVLGKSITIPAASGTTPGSVTFDAVSDFSGAETAAISVKAVANSDIAHEGFAILVYWAMPEVEFFAANDVILGSDFKFYIQGGGVVPVYGPELRLVIENYTTAAVNLDHLTVYAVTRATPAAATEEPAGETSAP